MAQNGQRTGAALDWIRGSRRPAAGVALLIHGLNLNPARMQGIIDALRQDGVDCLRLSLTGHGRNFAALASRWEANERLEHFKRVSYALWREETLAAYRDARRQAEAEGAPLFLVGFSYGALIGLDLLAGEAEVNFERMVLFAPAIRLHVWCLLIRLLAPFPRLVLPSISPPQYLANRGTPVAGYNSLFETLDHFTACVGPRINLPTIVFIDPGDELVSCRGLRQFMARQNLDRWRLAPVRKSAAAVSGLQPHLIIDEPAVGKAAWLEMKNAMRRHLLPGRSERAAGV